MKLLIVEDDKKLAIGLKFILEKEGFDVDINDNGRDGYLSILSGIYHLCLLDVNLPNMSGFSIVKDLSNHESNTPIIFLTARSSCDDRVNGLNLGAVDYITKPFDTRELILRINLRLNNPNCSVKERYSFGNTFLNETNFSICCYNSCITLNNKEFRIIEYLFINRNKIVSRDALITKIWGIDSQIEERSLDVYISMIRKKLKFINSDIEIVAKRYIGYYIKEITKNDF